MSRLTIDHTTPSGTVAYGAYLYFDDGDFPNAEIQCEGYFETEAEAWDAVKAALKDKPTSRPSEVEPGNTAVWSGCPEKGTFVKDDDDEWFVPPGFEADGDYMAEPIYHHGD